MGYFSCEPGINLKRPKTNTDNMDFRKVIWNSSNYNVVCLHQFVIFTKILFKHGQFVCMNYAYYDLYTYGHHKKPGIFAYLQVYQWFDFHTIGSSVGDAWFCNRAKCLMSAPICLTICARMGLYVACSGSTFCMWFVVVVAVVIGERKCRKKTILFAFNWWLCLCQ